MTGLRGSDEEQWFSSFLEQPGPAGRIYFDLGAHFGCFTVLALQRDGSSFVYDPMSRKGADGKLDQVTTDGEGLRAYRDNITPVGIHKYAYSKGM